MKRGATPVRPKLVIDEDGGADDAMAIFMALICEKYLNGPQVVGLTTVFGNVNESQAYINTQRILNIAERKDVPIYRGAASPFVSGIESDYFFGMDGLGDNEVEDYDKIPARPIHAALALIHFSHLYGDKLIVVAIGSLTNIGLAMKLDPGFISRIGQLYVGAGHIHGAKYKEPEFNAAMDPEAYHIVANHSYPSQVTVVPFSPILTHVQIEKNWRINVLGKIPTAVSSYMIKFERKSIAAVNYWANLDPAVMAVALRESLVDEFKLSLNTIILCGTERGVTPHDFISENPNARVVVQINKIEYMIFLYTVFSTPVQDLGLRD
ncbi:probable uridine nucleosidase 2 isoform X1 [Pieris rapae]|uniref:probable uridine nucleosidase 2 isoform X1 n=1 Tax=Pieris rapae TaxID=64459 RepID=UPI001E27BF44|nr:probable uridine nucleosidase 2 isoform X1 [Pieris rapae]